MSLLSQFKRLEVEKVFVPEGKKRQLLYAYGEYISATKEQRALKHYDFWLMAETICPSIKEGNWKAFMFNGTEPYFARIKDEED